MVQTPQLDSHQTLPPGHYLCGVGPGPSSACTHRGAIVGATKKGVQGRGGRIGGILAPGSTAATHCPLVS